MLAVAVEPVVVPGVDAAASVDGVVVSITLHKI